MLDISDVGLPVGRYRYVVDEGECDVEESGVG